MFKKEAPRHSSVVPYTEDRDLVYLSATSDFSDFLDEEEVPSVVPFRKDRDLVSLSASSDFLEEEKQPLQLKKFNSEPTPRQKKFTKSKKKAKVPASNKAVKVSELQKEESHDVMISYHWDNQLIVNKIRDELQSAGFKVWIDRDNAAYTLDEISAAIDKALVVLIGMSKKYEESARCRTEAEYTFKLLRKKCIPLKLEKDYLPRGWLGLLVAGQIYYDMTLDDLARTMTKLINDVRNAITGDNTTEENVKKNTNIPSAPPLPQRLTKQQQNQSQAQLPSYYISEGSHNRPKINPKDLILAKKNLVSSNPAIKIHLERNDVFEQYGIFSHMPLYMVTDYMHQQSLGLTGKVVSINLTGIEQITDMFFYCLQVKQVFFPQLKTLTLTGCHNITDLGVKWLSYTMDSLTEVVLKGCHKVTHRSIHYFCTDAASIPNYIDLTSTACAVVTDKLHGKYLGSLNLHGCPLISPPNDVYIKNPRSALVDATFHGYDVYKVVVLEDPDSALKSGLLTKKLQKQDPGFMATTKWKTQSGKSSNEFNVFEVVTGSHVEDLFLSNGGVVIVTYRDMEDSTVRRVTRLLMSVLGQYPENMFVLAGTHADNNIDEMKIKVIAQLQKYLEYLEKYKDFGPKKKDWVLNEFQFCDQMMFTFGQALVQYLGQMVEPDSKYLSFVHLPDGKDANEFQFLDKLVDEDLKTMFPWHCVRFFLQTVKAFKTLEKNVHVPLSTLNKIVSALPVDVRFNFNPRSGFQEIGKAMELLHDKGTCLYFPDVTRQPAFTDISKFEQVLTITRAAAPQNIHIRGLGNNIPCWLYSDLKSIVGIGEGNLRLLLLDIMIERGLVLRFPRESESTDLLNTVVYVLSKDLPEEPAVPLNEIWPEDLPAGEKQREMYYTFPSLPEWLFPYFLRELCNTSKFTLVWKTGIVLLQGPVSVLVQLLENHVQGLPAIVICARMENLQETWLQDMLLVAYNNITAQLQSILLSRCVYAVKTVCCKTCNPTQNHFVAMDKTKDCYFFTEIEVKSRHDRGLYCKKEGNRENVISKQEYLGPEYLTHKAHVPNHVDPYIIQSKDSNKMATTTRCYLCNNCIVEGMACQNNLTNGMTSRHCSCKKVGNHCQYCGVCRSCVTSLAKAHAIVQPHFDESKDDIKNVRRSGSVLSFALEGKQYEFPHYMTLEYFSELEIRLCRGCHFNIICEYSKKSVMNFATGDGIITINGEEKKSGLVCKTGDAVKFNLLSVTSDGEVTMLEVKRNDESIFSMELLGNKTRVSVKAVRPGNIVIITPHLMGMEKLTAENEKETVKCCGPFPTIIERKMSMMYFKVEKVLFKNPRVDFTGAAGILLPEKLSQTSLNYPSFSALRGTSVYHPLCMTRSNTGIEIESDNDTWIMANLLHLVNGSGYTLESEVYDIAKKLIWGWHCQMIHYPVVGIPPMFEKLLPALTSDTKFNEIQQGIQELLRLRAIQMFSSLGEDFNASMFNNVQELDNASLELQTQLSENVDRSGLVTTGSLLMPDRMLYLCPGHIASWQIGIDLEEIPKDMFGGYSQFITSIKVSNNRLTNIPPSTFENLPNLLKIDLSENFLEFLPDSIGLCRNLQFLELNENNLTDLPMSLADCSRLYRIDITKNCMDILPPVLTKTYSLVRILANGMLLTALPENIGNLTNLEKLYMNGNCLTKLPKSFEKLQKLQELSLSGVAWLTQKRPNALMSHKHFEEFLMKRGLSQWFDIHTKDRDELFKLFDKDANGTLNPREIGRLNSIIFNLFPRFGYKGVNTPDDDTPSGFPSEILQLRNLLYLNLTYQGIVHIPKDIQNLNLLQNLIVNDNPNLLSVAAEAGVCPLKRLVLDHCPLLKTPPKEIRDRGFSTTVAYLRRLMTGSVECKRTKLMMVGLGGVGKTSLVRALRTNDLQKNLTTPEEITDGIDICNWEVDSPEGKITYSVWDFAGQTVYNNTHQFFLSSRAVYLLLWNVRQGHEHAGLDFWLNSISVHAPNAPIFVVGTHIDEVSKIELPMEQMQESYRQIEGFHFISSYDGMGIDDLKAALFKSTVQQEYMGEQIPEAWLQLENILYKVKTDHSKDVLDITEVEKIATEAGIVDRVELGQAVQFLHDLGAVQHFTNEYLKSKVVINPQWLVDVMACVVSVKQTAIKEGRLKHSDIGEIWKDYPQNMHDWLLRLTEEFDLTYPLEGESCNVVPCLLPETVAKFDWPEANKKEQIYETKMVYNFDYLPAGLFNRGQVRLHEFSDGISKMWKRGSYLSKNGQIALLHQIRESELLIKVHGPRPDNLLFAIFEVFESLINESFQGLVYDYQIPCPDCVKQCVKDPHLFKASTIRRALELNAPFLTCLTYFHIPTVVSLQAVLTPDTNSDFDVHLEKVVSNLHTLRDAMAVDIFISYCSRDAPPDRSKVIHPATVCEDLEKAGYSCYYPEGRQLISTHQMAKALLNASVFLVFLSDNYVQDETCCDLFKYAVMSLKKNVVHVMVGEGVKWKSSSLGVFLSDVVYVNMAISKKPLYKTKLEELLVVLDKRAQIIVRSADKAPCFISYAWSNSAEAVAQGTRKNPEALGYGDPRVIKKQLESNGIPCWLDIEQIGGQQGLFEDIVVGLSNAQVFVACVSDEYANSINCKKEFRYAAWTLKLPVVLAIVGTKDGWKQTEVGFHALSYPIVDFQRENKNAFKDLTDMVKARIKDEKIMDAQTVEEKKKKKDQINEEKANRSFQEMYELAQRKFLRQIITYASTQEIGNFPRLFVVDLVEKTAPKKNKNAETDDSNINVERENSPDSFKSRRFQVHTLCECEQGWHSDSDPILLPEDFTSTSLEMFAGYLIRVTNIVKHSQTFFLNLLSEPDGQQYARWIGQAAANQKSDYQASYQQFRQLVMDLDTEQSKGKLKRCRLQSGKTIWLCEKHTKELRLTVLSDEITETKHQSKVQAGIDHMNESLRTPVDVPIKFLNSFKAKRQPSDKKTDDVESDLRRVMSRTSSTINKAALSHAISEVEQINEEPETPEKEAKTPRKKKPKKEKHKEKKMEKDDKTTANTEVVTKEDMLVVVKTEENIENKQSKEEVAPTNEDKPESFKEINNTSMHEPLRNENSNKGVIQDSAQNTNEKVVTPEPLQRQVSIPNIHRIQTQEGNKKPAEPQTPKSKSKFCSLM